MRVAFWRAHETQSLRRSSSRPQLRRTGHGTFPRTSSPQHGLCQCRLTAVKRLAAEAQMHRTKVEVPHLILERFPQRERTTASSRPLHLPTCLRFQSQDCSRCLSSRRHWHNTSRFPAVMGDPVVPYILVQKTRPMMCQPYSRPSEDADMEETSFSQPTRRITSTPD